MISQAPDVGGPAQPLLIARGLVKHFPVKGGLLGRKATVRAVDGVSFEIRKGETLGIVGESGCGKSTTARLLMALMQPTAGEIIFDGESLTGGTLSLRDYRRQVQMVFQDSYSSLNPRLTIEESIAFAPQVHGLSAPDSIARARELLDSVGLDPSDFGHRYPHELSGGQRQRVNIARALALRSRLIILDEPVSALDKSVESQVLNLLSDIKAQFDLTYLLISHDLNVVQYIADRVLVMYMGQVAEIGDVGQFGTEPFHPYTQALFASRPSTDPRRRRVDPPLTGEPPNPIDPPPGCRFRPRCKFSEAVCAQDVPLKPVSASHSVACTLADPASGHSRAVKPDRPAIQAVGSGN
jgi:peptide/nickel transport system ATP-binding protein